MRKLSQAPPSTCFFTLCAVTQQAAGSCGHGQRIQPAVLVLYRKSLHGPGRYGMARSRAHMSALMNPYMDHICGQREHVSLYMGIFAGN